MLSGLIAGNAACGGGSGGGSAVQVANRPPQPAFTVAPANGAAPLQVEFDGSSSNDSDGTVTSFVWHFGDGSPDAVGSRVGHPYTDSGSYAAQLTITDDRGATASRTVTVNVTPASGTFTLSGRIQILPSSAIDSDVNDPLAPLTTNDDFTVAQPLPNPVSLGGYLNRPGSGASGTLHDSGDPTDTFVIDCAGAEAVLLTVSNPAASVTLSVFEAAMTLLDSTIVSGGSGSLTIPAAGRYFVELDITAAASNYLLNVGQDVPATAATLPARLSDAFVPGEMIVDGAAQLEGLHRRGGRDRIGLFGIDAAAFPAAAHDIHGLRRGGRVHAALAEKYPTLTAIARVARLESVRHAEPNYYRYASRVPSDALYRYQWNYPSIGLPQAWEVTQGSSDVVVAVIDTGVLPNHPDLAGQFMAGYDFIRDPVRARDGDGIDPDPTDAGDLGYGGGSTFHGTHVAGTVAANSDNGSGVAGVAWHTRLMPLRVLGVNGGTSYDIIQAVRYAARLSNDSGRLPVQRADIINLSLGGRTSSQIEQATYDQARAAGVIVVAAAGNQATGTPSFPAGYGGVVSVAASTITKARAPYSNFGPTIDVIAPGGNLATDVNGDGLGDGIVSTLGDDSHGALIYGYAALSGTSMAAPHVAGVAALMKAIDPALTPTQFDAALASGQLTDDLGAAGRDDQFGWGLINAPKAVSYAVALASGAGIEIAPLLVATPTAINFGAFDSRFDVELANAGGGALSIIDVSSNQPWLSVAPAQVDGDGLGTYRVQVDRAAVPADGTYSGQITATSTVNAATIAAVMQRFTGSPTANAGVHYVLLIDTVTGLVVDETVANANNGEYVFEFTNVGPGQYWIYAGSDNDNDQFICDAGEACGAFRTLDAAEAIAVNGDRAALDFISGFPINLFGLSSIAATASTTPPIHAPIRRPER